MTGIDRTAQASPAQSPGHGLPAAAQSPGHGLPAAAQLAQANIATLRASIDDPSVADFVMALDRINALAEASPGFVWRLVGAGNDATDVPVTDDPLEIANLSVWTDAQTLREYVYASEHVGFLRRRAEWFQRGSSQMAMWWVPPGQRPTVAEAVMRCTFQERHGASPFSFWFRDSFPVLTIEPRTLDHPDSIELTQSLDRDLLDLTPPGASNFFGLEPSEVDGGSGTFLVAYLDGRAVGCGGFRRIEPAEVGPGVAEIKRMYVAPDARGSKIGAGLLAMLEHTARQQGFVEARLETGPHLTSAVALYRGAGYEQCEPWGEYRSALESVCYRRLL